MYLSFLKRLKSNYSIFSVLLLVVICSCEKEPNFFSLDAKITNVSEGTRFYLYDITGGTHLDSALVKDGSIFMKAKLDHPKKLMLSGKDLKSQEFIYTLLVVGNEHIKFEADKKDFPWGISVSGSKHQDIAQKFHQMHYLRQKSINELRTKYLSQRAIYTQKIKHISDSLDTAVLELIKQEFNSYAALSEFKYHRTAFSNAELGELYKMLSTDLKESIAGKAIKTQSEYKQPKVGDKYYDFAAINQHGDSLSLSSFKDKFILLHFSSSACYASQLSLEELKDFYKKHSPFLEIVAISEDVKKEQWLNTVKKNAIPWTYLWDGKGEYTDAVSKYWKIGTPNYVLISPDKIILEDWYGYEGGEFEAKLNKYFIK